MDALLQSTLTLLSLNCFDKTLSAALIEARRSFSFTGLTVKKTLGSSR